MNTFAISIFKHIRCSITRQNNRHSSCLTIYLHISLTIHTHFFDTKMPATYSKTILQGTIDGVRAQNKPWVFFARLITRMTSILLLFCFLIWHFKKYFW